MRDYSNGEIFKSSDTLGKRQLLKALTVHPIKEPQLMYRVHQFYIELAISNLKSRTNKLASELERISSLATREGTL